MPKEVAPGADGHSATNRAPLRRWWARGEPRQRDSEEGEPGSSHECEWNVRAPQIRAAGRCASDPQLARRARPGRPAMMGDPRVGSASGLDYFLALAAGGCLPEPARRRCGHPDARPAGPLLRGEPERANHSDRTASIGLAPASPAHVRRHLLPRLVMPTSLGFLPIVTCRGMRPSRAAGSRSQATSATSPMAVTSAVALRGPILFLRRMA